MNLLKEFLSECRTDDSNKCTFLSLNGGKFYVPRDKKNRFFELWLEAKKTGSSLALVWRPPKREFRPIHFDFDIHLPSEGVVIPNKTFIEIECGNC